MRSQFGALSTALLDRRTANCVLPPPLADVERSAANDSSAAGAVVQSRFVYWRCRPEADFGAGDWGRTIPVTEASGNCAAMRAHAPSANDREAADTRAPCRLGVPLTPRAKLEAASLREVKTVRRDRAPNGRIEALARVPRAAVGRFAAAASGGDEQDGVPAEVSRCGAQSGEACHQKVRPRRDDVCCVRRDVRLRARNSPLGGLNERRYRPTNCGDVGVGLRWLRNIRPS